MQPREAFHQQTLSYKTYLLTAAQDSSFHSPAPPSFVYGRASREETANKIQLYNQPLPLLNVFFCKSYRVIIQAMIRVQIRFVRQRRQKLESEICRYYNILSYICSLVLTNPHLHKAGTYKNQCH